MKVGIIKASELGSRWDAGFHLLRQEMEPRTQELERTVSRQDALDRLQRIPNSIKKGLAPLARGSQSRSLDASAITVIQEEYPHLCLAILSASRDDAIQQIEAERERLHQTMLELQDIDTPSTSNDLPIRNDRDSRHFKSGWMYPLIDPDHFWDEDDGETYGIAPDKRYSYVRVPTDMDPAECTIIDVWVVDEDGQTHPGYDGSPVVIRMEDVDMSRGAPMAGATQRRKGIFESDWLSRH